MNRAIALSRIHSPSEGEGKLYGVLLFTERHAYIRKVLADEIFWDSLNSISGPKWIVFAAQAKPGRKEWRGDTPNGLGMMYSVWIEPEENRQMLEAFEIESTEDLPALAVFTEDQAGTVRKKIIKLKTTDEHAVFDDLSKWFDAIAKSLERMYPK